MCSLPKKLIIDKNIFDSTLPSPRKLLDFTHNHFVILPDVLYFECVTTSENKSPLLELFRDMILNGAYISPSCRAIIGSEAQTLVPYGPLVKLSEVDAVRKTFRENPTPYSTDTSVNLLQRDLAVARNLIYSANGFNEKLASESPELLKEVRKWDNSKKSKPERLCTWASSVDEDMDIHKLAIVWFSDLTPYHEKFCLSKEWFTWQFLRLVMILRQEMAFLRHTGGSSSEANIEHDLQDIQYVTLLSKSEGLLTKDKGCSFLAKAAFPEKDVFSSIDEVTEDYRY